MKIVSAAAQWLLIVAATSCATNPVQQQTTAEAHRPLIHFTPEAAWMNDPNGLVYHNGVYHLFYQHNPDSTVWGPMHWGHATSTDLVHWKRESIKLFPDSLGTIFSGSAVVDKNNTAGFGANALVAIFTHHDAEGEKAGRKDFQNQSLAYSLDNGNTWTKYANNPVLRSPDIRDFRDPKVMWYEPNKKWIMTLAASDRIIFYSSADLKSWTKESEFGEKAGAHGGVWECPDLFTLRDNNGKDVWVLIVNLNPGGPNKGSATQYFLGEFDGKTFTPQNTNTKWLDYGPDEYAGITWFNTGERRIFLGWMSNWLYANVVPTASWRNAMTIPRELSLKRVGSELLVASQPVKELSAMQGKAAQLVNLPVTDSLWFPSDSSLQLPARFHLKMDSTRDISFTFANELGERLTVGYDKARNQYYIDRTRSGPADFQADFAGRFIAPRFATGAAMDMLMVVDVSSVELFADEGLSVMTAIFFPRKPYDRLSISSGGKVVLKELEYTLLNDIWK